MPTETTFRVADEPFDEVRNVPTFHDFAIVCEDHIVLAKRGNGLPTVQTYVNRSIAERQLRAVQRTLPEASLWCRYGG